MGLLERLMHDPIGALTQVHTRNQAADDHINRLGDPGLSQRLGDYNQHYWWMDGGAAFSLAALGFHPSSAVAQAAAQVAAHVKATSGLGFNSPGSPMQLAGMPSTPDAIDHWSSALNQPTQGAVNPEIYAAGPKPPIANLFDDNTWRALDPNIKQELGQVQFVQSDPSVVNMQRTGGQAKAVYQMTGTAGLSIQAQTALRDAVSPQRGMTLLGPMVDRLNPTPPPGAYTPPKLTSDYVTFNEAPKQDLGGGQFGHLIPSPAQAMGVGGGGAGMQDLGTAIQGAQRGIQMAAIGAAAPLQEVQGQVRNVYQASVEHQQPNWLESQSDLGVWAGSGFSKDIGGGLLGAALDSPVHQELLKRQASRGLINGEPITLGRWFASNPLGFLIPGSNQVTPYNDAETAIAQKVIAPGSIAYHTLSGLTDAAFAIKADPTIVALRGLGEYRQAAETLAPGSIREAGQAARAAPLGSKTEAAIQAFHDAGGLGSLTHGAVDPDAVNRFLTSPRGAAKVEQIANTNGPDAVYRILDDHNWQMRPEAAVAMADTSDPQVVANIYRDELGARITKTPSMSNLDRPIVLESPMSHWVAMMPEHKIDGTNLAQNVQQVREIGALTKMPEAIPSWVDQMARTTSTSERQGAWQNIFDDVAHRLIDKSGLVKPVQSAFDNPAEYQKALRDYNQVVDRAMKLTHMDATVTSPQGTYAALAIENGTGMSTNTAVVAHEPVLQLANEPQRLAQTLNRDITFPDFGELRKALSPASKIYNNGLVIAGDELLSTGQRIWKYAQIANAKATIKILGDEQARIAARGYVSLWNHPLQAIGMIIAAPEAELPMPTLAS
jgi:hypothetical protein